MDWQLSNALFIAITTLLVFAALALVAWLTLGNRLKWKWIGSWMALGVTVVIIQIQGTAMPRVTVNTELPSVPNKQIEFQPTELIPKRPMKEWRDSTDKFDEEQDRRIEENKGD